MREKVNVRVMDSPEDYRRMGTKKGNIEHQNGKEIYEEQNDALYHM